DTASDSKSSERITSPSVHSLPFVKADAMTLTPTSLERVSAPVQELHRRTREARHTWACSTQIPHRDEARNLPTEPARDSPEPWLPERTRLCSVTRRTSRPQFVWCFLRTLRFLR